MSKELSRNLMAVVMMSGVVIWMERTRADKLAEKVNDKACPRLFEFEGQLFNPSSIEGVYSASTMEDLQRRKNGQWKCKEGVWHDRGERCVCEPFPIREIRKKLKAAQKDCGKCRAGYVQSSAGSVRPCHCSEAIFNELDIVSGKREKL